MIMNQNFVPAMRGAAMVSGEQRGEPTQRRFCRSKKDQLKQELTLRLERHSERVRIARELHDTLFQGFLGASMLLQDVVETMPAESPDRRSLGNALGLLRRVLDEGRAVLQGLRTPDFAPASIEKELSAFLEEFSISGVRCEISVTGHAKQLKPAVQEQINSIAREALVNALLHSQGTCVEIEVEYSARRLRVVVRDNGCGMDPELVRSRSDLHWGLLGMHERAENIGARLTVWSRPGAGTEVEISVPNQALQDACA
jgi:signal transduction histidine kinase